MRKSYIFIIGIVAGLAILLGACSALFAHAGGQDQQSAQGTAVMETVSAVLTQQAFETLVGQATQLATSPQSTPLPTQNPVQVATVVVTATPLPPTATPFIPTPTATTKPLPCNAAAYVKDVTIPDGTNLAAGQAFTKTWRLQNAGTCTWSSDYQLVFVDGTAMSGPASVSLGSSVKPGGTIDVSVNLVAPGTEGSYQGNWILRDSNGTRFGLGKNADQSFWVKIDVTGFQSDNVPSSIYPYDFVASICQADWKSNAGTVSLPCAGVDQGKPQWVAIEMNPVFEGGHQDNERTLWMHLQDKNDWMQGFYPATTIQSGDKFMAYVGCLEANKNCDATFSLDAIVDGGASQNLGKWDEVYDGKYTKINLDLSQFAGKHVEFILGVTNKNASGELDVFWFVPSVQH